VTPPEASASDKKTAALAITNADTDTAGAGDMLEAEAYVAVVEGVVAETVGSEAVGKIVSDGTVVEAEASVSVVEGVAAETIGDQAAGEVVGNSIVEKKMQEATLSSPRG
jgi:predicted metal-dependent phosphoesterase TrpH